MNFNTSIFTLLTLIRLVLGFELCLHYFKLIDLINVRPFQSFDRNLIENLSCLDLTPSWLYGSLLMINGHSLTVNDYINSKLVIFGSVKST